MLTGRYPRLLRRSVLLAWLAMILGSVSAHAQSSYIPPTIAIPIVDLIDQNHVSILTGKTQFSIKALELGGLSFAPFSWGGVHFQQGGIIDNNYGAVNLCAGAAQNPGGYVICSTASGGIQATHGEERGNFGFDGTNYYPDSADGSTFVDNGATCTWTQRDGTKIIYYAYHPTNTTSKACQSNNISSIVHPDGRVDTYYYYGSFVQGAYTWSPILSITTNTGYMLKYIYSGTPTFGSETNVIGINLAFQNCSPTALTCTLSSSWPTATLSWVTNPVNPCDNFPTGGVINPCNHYTFTIQDTAQRNHIFQLDSYFRITSYQPPEATSPVFQYTLCSLLNQDSNPSGQPMSNCFGMTRSLICQNGVNCGFNEAPYLWDLVSTVTRNGATWTYQAGFGFAGSLQAQASWAHAVVSPLGPVMSAGGNGNASSYLYTGIGPINNVQLFDGTVYHYEASTRNVLTTATSPLGVVKTFTYDPTRSNLIQIQTTPIPGSGTTQTPILKAVFPELTSGPNPVGVYPCVNMITCNKPTAVIDANTNETDYTYDPVHGGMLTQMDPAVQVNGSGPLVRPQITQTYVNQSAWYFNTSGTMASAPSGVWLPATQSTCMMTAANPATGVCAGGSTDQEITTYSYGPNSGPNNLLLRGKAVTANGLTLQTCYGHDTRGNKIWETSPNANPASCPTY